VRLVVGQVEHCPPRSGAAQAGRRGHTRATPP
jgi:hypothetical protein